MMCINVPFAADPASGFTAFAAEEVISESLTLQADKTVNGDLRLKGGTLDLAGHTLTVKGDVWVDDGIVNIGSGIMYVKGDFELRPDKNGWSSGELRMTNGDGVLDVDGSVELASLREKAEQQYSGRLRMTVTGRSAGKGTMQLANGSESKSKTLIVGASELEPVYDGGSAAPGSGKLRVGINGPSVYYTDSQADIVVTTSGEIPPDAWITFVPSDVPHTEKDGDDNNGDYVWLKDIKNNIAYLKTPNKPGTYDIRVYDGDDADTAKEVAYQTVRIIYSDLKATVRMDSKVIRPGEKVKVYLKLNGHVRDDAWVAFVPSDIAHNEKDSDDHNGDYARLKDLADGYVIITAPGSEGSWDIRVFDGEDADYAREVAYITVMVSKSEDATEPTDPPGPTEPTVPTEPAGAKLLPGDVNLDGTVNIMDVIAVNRYLLGLSELGETAKKNADVDGAEGIDASDSLLILKYVLEIVDKLGGTTAETVSFADVKITKYQSKVPANANAYGQLSLSGNTDLSGSSAWIGVVPAGTGDSEAEAD